ncbi:MAG TPA: substrate-binding domain-containing protein, partial [Polyangiaceae bacterium]
MTKGLRRRAKIALLLDYMSFLDGAYQSRISEAFHDAATALDVDLVILFGRGLDEPNPFSKSHNAVFDFPNSADGVVAVSTVLASHCGVAGVSALLERYGKLPRVSVGVELPGVASVIVDNQLAMEAVVEHVVAAHGRRRVAFLSGPTDNPESEARLAGYRRVLARHGLPTLPELVGYGNFVQSSARAAVTEILERAGSIDALIGANDAMAFCAVEVLRERGLSVPDDVVVTGFDDVWLGRLGGVSLTTVAQPFERMAEQALALVLRQIAGEGTEPVTQVAAHFVVRRSCGCGSARQAAAGEEASGAPLLPAAHFELHEQRLAALLETQLGGARATRTGQAERFFDALKAELSGAEGAFLAELERAIRRYQGDHDAHQALHGAIDALREDFRETVVDRKIDDLWYRALSRIAHATSAASVEHRLRLDDEYQRLLSTADRVSVAFDLKTLADAMVASLHNVGIGTAFVSRLADAIAIEVEPLVTLLDGESREVPSGSFPAAEIVPPGVREHDRRRSLAVFPLVFETHWLGIAAFEYVPGSHGYQLLRDQFAFALGHVALHQQLLSKTMLHERSVQERQATTQRLDALSVLAGGVAHDLNNTLGPLVALPDIVTAELERFDSGHPEHEVLQGVRADMQTMKSAGLRAAQTIKDLLTLGRQGRTAKETLDLGRVVQLELTEVTRVLAREYPQVQVKLELGADPLMIRGSEAHLARAVTNLVRNAAEAIAGAGTIVVTTEFVQLSESLSGYETIAPGEYAVLRVADTGSGIPAPEIQRVFEPFFSRKRLGERSGSGLGLAIVYGTAKEHDGFVDLSSTLGAGTTFSLYFPNVRETSRIRSVRPETHRSSARILVIDDDALQARIARRVLAHLG